MSSIMETLRNTLGDVNELGTTALSLLFLICFCIQQWSVYKCSNNQGKYYYGALILMGLSLLTYGVVNTIGVSLKTLFITDAIILLITIIYCSTIPFLNKLSISLKQSYLEKGYKHN